MFRFLLELLRELCNYFQSYVHINPNNAHIVSYTLHIEDHQNGYTLEYEH